MDGIVAIVVALLVSSDQGRCVVFQVGFSKNDRSEEEAPVEMRQPFICPSTRPRSRIVAMFMHIRQLLKHQKKGRIDLGSIVSTVVKWLSREALTRPFLRLRPQSDRNLHD